MPSRVPGYPGADAAARPPYPWPHHPPPPRQPPAGPTASPPGAQPQPYYYGYPVVPPASYEAPPHYPPPPQPARPHEGADQSPDEVRPRVDPYRRSPYSRALSGSPPSGSNSHEHHDYHRPPEGPPPPPYGPPPVHPSLSMTSTGSQQKTSPPKYPPPNGAPPHGPPPPNGYREAVPHSHLRPPPPSGSHAGSSFDSDRPYPPPPPESGAYPPPPDRGTYDERYGWGGPVPPYGQARAYPPPPQPRRPDYNVHRPHSFESRQTSEAGNRDRPVSPTQIETSRRDEVANMGCTCKKSKCLKLYCMCFGASVVCGPNCRCLVCYNTPSHETERKEAVRAILSRNPAAFDTKFRKNTDTKAVETDRVLSHKIGCKCRKSSCTKKYCECFNAGIKCSATCRCIGCQNMPPGGFGPVDPRYGYPFPVPAGQPNPRAVNNGPTPVVNNGPEVVNNSTAVVNNGYVPEMDAAQNLAFLKHASPAKPEGKPLGPTDGSGIAQMPSLVSTDTTPTSETQETPKETTKKEDNNHKKPETGVANALLMAAYAMAELHNDGGSKSSSPTTSPDGSMRASPKRKSLDSSSGREPAPFPESSKQYGKSATDATMTTPSAQQRKTKRSRVGTAKKRTTRSSSKKATNGNSDSPAQSNPKKKDEVIVTPAKTTRSRKKKEVLTPVSARCIDFRRMDVSEKKRGKGKKSKGKKSK